MNKQPITPDAVLALHEEYCRITDQEGFPCRYDRLRGWVEWIRAGHTVEDLRLVVRYLRRGIAAGKRNEGALKWRNLIGQLDIFEEDLFEARRTLRPKRPAIQPAPTGTPAAPAPQPDAITFSRLRREAGV